MRRPSRRRCPTECCGGKDWSEKDWSARASSFPPVFPREARAWLRAYPADERLADVARAARLDAEVKRRVTQATWPAGEGREKRTIVLGHAYPQGRLRMKRAACESVLRGQV